MSCLRGSNLVFHLTTSVESDLISCSDHPDSHFSKPPPVGPAALLVKSSERTREARAVGEWKCFAKNGMAASVALTCARR